MKKTLLIALLFLSACTQKQDIDKLYSGVSSESGFDTKIELMANVKDQSEFDHYFALTKDLFLGYNKLFDKYNDYEGINNIKTINDNAGIAPVSVDPLIIEMLLIAKDFTEITDGYFDITLGAVLEIWHDYREEGLSLNAENKPGNIPSMEILEEAAQYTGWKFVEIDSVNNTVYLTHERVKLDVGAIAKGYATELVALELEAEGLKHAIVNGGGNVRTIGTKASGAPWRIGVQSPAETFTNSNLKTFAFEGNTSVVASGDYQRYYMAEGQVRMSHLINPKTLMPESDFRAITIVTENSTQADSLSTAVYMMSYEESLKFIERFNAQYPEDSINIVWISDFVEGWEVVDEFSINMTEGLRSKLIEK